MRPHLRFERLTELLHYDPETGFFTWRVKPGRPQIKAGDRAGHVCKTSGYRTIRIDGRLYQAGRLAWFYVRGSWPPEFIDHINRKRDDNRWCNLRLASCAQNNLNRTPYGKSGVLGVWLDARTGRYAAMIALKGKRTFLGRFDTIEEAKKAVDKVRRELHGEFCPV